MGQSIRRSQANVALPCHEPPKDDFGNSRLSGQLVERLLAFGDGLSQGITEDRENVGANEWGELLLDLGTEFPVTGRLFGGQPVESRIALWISFHHENASPQGVAGGWSIATTADSTRTNATGVRIPTERTINPA